MCSGEHMENLSLPIYIILFSVGFSDTSSRGFSTVVQAEMQIGRVNLM